MVWDMITIGGGAAGYFGAIICSQNTNHKSLILERSSTVLNKVKISGGGRCNVTHNPSPPADFVTEYPRGEKALIGPFHRFGSQDTIDWFESRGVKLKTEGDGRIFPTTDSSHTIINCLIEEAADKGIETRTKAFVKSVHQNSESSVFEVTLEDGEKLEAKNLLLASGRTRTEGSSKLARELGHSLNSPVPSLFTFKIHNKHLTALSGVSVDKASMKLIGSKLQSSGPLLITHWGLSGPCTLRLSAWGARELERLNYEFEVEVDWLPNIEVVEVFNDQRKNHPKRQLAKYSPFKEIPKRLWHSFLDLGKIEYSKTWSHLSKSDTERLCQIINSSCYQVEGQSLNKEEFVTCGGVPTKEINMKTMESRITPNLFFAGEVIDIDGITGGFNFQNAWTSGWQAGTEIASRLEV